MSISEQVKELRLIAEEYGKPPYGREVRGTVEALCKAADTIESLSTKLQAANTERSAAHDGGGRIPCKERLPEESLNSVDRFDIWKGVEE